ncbi:MAG: phosphoadenosine phosphosulfate reductase family protein [Alphaproteobacteria bacterium]|nr:phosphoadenosine phosphosulfate reductase family protein [Alphaproteobacteria bacterium]MDA8029886.1 phosphoadenosine phosphosulfate reductase family protein [Alphaproteobacteria bacterium]
MRSSTGQITLTGGKVEQRMKNLGMEKSGKVRFYGAPSEDPDAILREVEEVHGRTKFYALTSGGKDSVGVCHYLAERGRLEAAVHIQTNVGFQATTDFIRDYSKEMGWPLRIIQPNPKYTYASMVLEHGFPGPGSHKVVMGVIKYRTMRNFAYAVDKKRHCLISGVRKWESVQRMGNYPLPITNDTSLWFACPFFYWTDNDVYRYKIENGLKVTPVHDIMGMSGECMCGAFAGKNEKVMLQKADPRLARYIKWLEEGVREFGTAEARRHPTWGSGARMSDVEDQQYMDRFFDSNPDLRNIKEMEAYTCGQECGPGTMKGAMNY